VLIGSSGSGKTTFAKRHFKASQVVSSDECRARITDDPHHLNCSADAFAMVYFLTRLRLRHERITVVDSTAVEWMTREALLEIANDFNVPKIALVFAIPEHLCILRDASRQRPVGRDVISKQKALMAEALQSLDREGWDTVLHLDPTAQDTLRLVMD